MDDNTAVRRGVDELISSSTAWRVCGHASDGAEGLQKAVELRPDVVLLDISMPGASGLEVASKLRREVPEAAIIIMTQHDPVRMLPRAIEAGAHACVDKSGTKPGLCCEAVESVASQ